mmetsp:Transcript_7656/g.22578  ORF Transcript_7656/g.22578 Transcript_7656/m.22578 type:complete len:225 (+) Transcript_7656:705-1379(+)
MKEDGCRKDGERRVVFAQELARGKARAGEHAPRRVRRHGEECARDAGGNRAVAQEDVEKVLHNGKAVGSAACVDEEAARVGDKVLPKDGADSVVLESLFEKPGDEVGSDEGLQPGREREEPHSNKCFDDEGSEDDEGRHQANGPERGEDELHHVDDLAVPVDDVAQKAHGWGAGEEEEADLALDEREEGQSEDEGHVEHEQGRRGEAPGTQRRRRRNQAIAHGA